MNQRRSLPTVLAVSMVLVALSAVAAWIAVGGLANATDRALARMESALLSARDLADSTASSASELQQVVAVVGDGLGKTAEAVAATREVSKSVRELLGLVDFIGSVESLVNSLEEAEKDLVFVQGSLITASTTLDQAAPALQETVDALAAVPGEIDAAIADSQEAREKIDNQVWLWRLAIAAGALAIIGGLWGVRANARRVDALLVALGQPASPAA